MSLFQTANSPKAPADEQKGGPHDLIAGYIKLLHGVQYLFCTVRASH